MGKRLNALPEVVEVVQTCRDGSSPVNQEIVTLGDGPPLDDRHPPNGIAIKNPPVIKY